jgi:N-acetylglucosaminyldiphosphoundecaprenol N-acetyl-beta-D-mannosaminyltransferase
MTASTSSTPEALREDGATAGPRVDVLGVAIDALDMDQTVERCAELIDRGDYVQQVSINTAKLIALDDDPALREVVNRCGLINADGAGVVLAARLMGAPLPGRVPGIDLMHRLLSLAEQRSYRVFVLGAKADVLEQAVQRLRAEHPALTIAGWRDGYFTDDEADEVCAEIRAARPHILFVAISSPRKELFLGEYGPTLGAPLVMGVGGSIDVVAGITRRAPELMQKLGLEWFFRLAQEPRRLARRYVVSNARFALLLARELPRRLLRRGR